MALKQRNRIAAVVALILAFVLVIGLVVGALATSVHAAKSDEIQERLDALKERKDENDQKEQEIQSRLNENYDQVRTLVEQKRDLDERINGTRERMAELNHQIEEMNLSIAAKQSELDESEAERAEMNEKYRQRIRTMEETGTISYWSVLFNATSFADLLSRVDMINEIVTADQLMLDQMEALLKRIDLQRKELEMQKQELEDKRQEMVELNLQLEADRLEADSYIQQINSDIGMLNALFMEYENLEAELSEEIKATQVEYDEAKAKEDEERRKREAAAAAARQSQVQKNPKPGSTNVSGFLFPLPAGIGAYITDSFGYRYHPITGVYKMHYGVDFAVPSGTPIYASKAGTVIVRDYGTINGNYIKLSHSDGTQTYYLHMNTFSVNQGDYVSQGQQIGTVGSTGSSTGPHLHFQIMVNGEAVNPMEYVSLQ